MNKAFHRHITATAIGLTIAATAWAQRPIVQTNFTPDPAPMVYNDTFYIYTGHDEDGRHDEFVMNEWRVYSSKDMVNWTDHGSPMSLDTFSWAEWAPGPHNVSSATVDSTGMYAAWTAEPMTWL